MENENKKINHIAIAVPDIKEAALKWQQALNMKKSEIIILEEHGVKVVFLEFSNLKIELLEPLDNESPISKFLEKNPKGMMKSPTWPSEALDSCCTGLDASPTGPDGPRLALEPSSNTSNTLKEA